MRNKGLTFKNARKKRYSCTLHTHLVATLWKLYKSLLMFYKVIKIVIDWEHVKTVLKKIITGRFFCVTKCICLFAENQETSWSTQKVSNVKLMLQVKCINKIVSWWKINNSKPQGCALALVFGSRQFNLWQQGHFKFFLTSWILHCFLGSPNFFVFIIVFH